MNLLKAVGKNKRVIGALSWLAARYIRLVATTTRWQVEGIDPALAAIAARQPFLGGFWHGRMVMMPGLWKRYAPGADIRMLISLHRDGRFVAQAVERLGFRTIAGSSRRGGAQALRQITEALDQGANVAITPDGPRGPRMRASLGIVGAASRAEVPIFIGSASASRGHVFKSWDRFLLPMPFARVAFVIKGPFHVPPDADDAALEEARARIEAALNDATREADVKCGRTPIEPAPAPVPAIDAAPAAPGRKDRQPAARTASADRP